MKDYRELYRKYYEQKLTTFRKIAERIETRWKGKQGQTGLVPFVAVNAQGDPYCCQDKSQLFNRHTEIDTLFISVSPMDRQGYFCTGAAGKNSEELIRKANRIYLEVDEKLTGDISAPLIHISQVEALCERAASFPVHASHDLDDMGVYAARFIFRKILNGQQCRKAGHS